MSEQVLPDQVSAVVHPDGAHDLRPDWTMLLCGTLVIAILSALFLDWPAVIASTLLGGLMIYGADVDARHFLLPDVVTLGGVPAGLLAAALLDPADPWTASAMAMLRAFGLALLLDILRRSYAAVRGREGLGFGDVKLAATIGAWLPLDAIPLCFALAAGAGLSCAGIAYLRGAALENTTKLPFGLFLCPALWLSYFTGLLPLSL